jgi:hypothetical protein
LAEKERADYEHALNLERQKIKNGIQERQMLCARIEELEQGERDMKAKSNEVCFFVVIRVFGPLWKFVCD